MLKKAVRYEDPMTEETKTAVVHLHLTKMDCIDLETGPKGSMMDRFKAIKQDDVAVILDLLREIIGKAYGVNEGGRFIKSSTATDEFLEGPVFEALVFDLIGSPDQGASFFTDIMPKGLFRADGNVKTPEEMAATFRGNGQMALTEPEDERPAWIREDRDPTQAEMAKMSQPELIAAFKRKSQA